MHYHEAHLFDVDDQLSVPAADASCVTPGHYHEAHLFDVDDQLLVPVADAGCVTPGHYHEARIFEALDLDADDLNSMSRNYAWAAAAASMNAPHHVSRLGLEIPFDEALTRDVAALRSIYGEMAEYTRRQAAGYGAGYGQAVNAA